MRRRIYGGIILGVSAIAAFIRVQPALAANTPLDEANAIICLNTLLLQPTCLELIERIEPSVEICKFVPTDPTTDAERYNTIGALHNKCDDAKFVVPTGCEKGVGALSCCITETKEESVLAGNPCVTETEECPDGRAATYSCCICQYVQKETKQPGHIFIEKSGHTYASCEALCAERYADVEGHIYRLALGAGALPKKTAAPSAQSIEESRAYCFKQDECLTDDYAGKDPSAFRPGFGCPAGEGRCIAPEPEMPLTYCGQPPCSIGGITTVKGFRGFVSAIFQFLIGVVATVAAIMFVYAGFRYIFGSAFDDIKKAKELMVNSTIGLVMIIGAIAILRTVNPMTLNLNKLEIFMINQSRVFTSSFCTDLKSDDKAKKLMFADAGERPNFKQPADIKEFAIEQGNTECNYEYYGENFGAFRCKGRKCPEVGMACVACDQSKEFCPETASKGSWGCVKGSFGGTITYADERRPEEVYPVVICNQAFDTEVEVTTSEGKKIMGQLTGGYTSQALVKIVGSKKIITGENDCGEGKIPYAIRFGQEEVDGAEKYCNEGGRKGVAGFVLAVQYNDPGAVFCNTPLDVDEFIAVGKNDCGKNTFSGMANGHADNSDEDDARRSVACGIKATPNSLKNPENLWTIDEVRQAAGLAGIAKTIECDLTINGANAPEWSSDDTSASVKGDTFGGLICPLVP